MNLWKFIVFNFKKSPSVFINPIILVPAGYTVSSSLRHNFNVLHFFAALSIGLTIASLGIIGAYIVLKVQKKI